MLTPATNSATAALATPPESARKVLRMVHNERMGGSVPAWVDAATVKDEIQENLRSATVTSTSVAANPLALNAPVESAVQTREEPFGFADLLDMFNPLQHIPVVSHLYRELTGDTMKPASNIIGGAVFGGPLGAAIGLVDVIVKEETGKDIATNAVSFAMNGDLPEYKTAKKESYSYSTQTAAYDDLPGELLAFVNLAHPEIVIEKTDDASLHLKEIY